MIMLNNTFNKAAMSEAFAARDEGIGFNPLDDLCLTQDAKPRHLQPINWRKLTPFQRTLLVIDGTVTKFLEAYMLEPIEVTVLRQEAQPLVADHAWLEATAGTSVIMRQVLLQGRYSGVVYTYAVSLLVTDRLPADLLSKLAIEPSGLGRALLNSQLENRREVLWYGYERIVDLPEMIGNLIGMNFLSRTYRIIAHQQPIMLINEKFPCHNGLEVV
jgi:chorismate-pyruvate lyase